MTDSIVVCPGCAKRYQVPAGIVVPPGSTFACTVCTMAVPYGAAGDGGAGAAPARASAPARAGAAPRRPAAGGRAPARGRGGARGAVDDGAGVPGGRAAPSSSNMTTIAILSVVGLGAGIFFLIKMMPERRSARWISDEEQALIDKEKAEKLAAPTAPSKPPAENVPYKPPPRDPPPPPIYDQPGLRAQLARLDPDHLFRPIPDLEGVTPQQRAAFDKDVEIVLKREATSETADARARLVGAGRNAMPALLSVFTRQWDGGGWGDNESMRTSHVTQQILYDIVKRDRPTAVPATWESESTHAAVDEFDRVARVWVNWWNAAGRKLPAFRDM